MGKVNVAKKSDSQRHRAGPYPTPSSQLGVLKEAKLKKKCLKEANDWENATCSVCMEPPHNAVLLLCCSYHKGCRPYMCATSSRYSNCLDQYKEAYTKIVLVQEQDGMSDSDVEVEELLCPLCRGQVKGWTVVEPAREHLNAEKRSCMKDGCTFVGNYKQLRKHVRAKHPLARPCQVDPIREEKWKTFEGEREREDVISTIRSSAPGAIVMGDYVIEGNYGGGLYRGHGTDEHLDNNSLFRLESVGLGRGVSFDSRWSSVRLLDGEDDFGSNGAYRPLIPGTRLRRFLYGGRAGRRRRRRRNGGVAGGR